MTVALVVVETPADSKSGLAGGQSGEIFDDEYGNYLPAQHCLGNSDLLVGDSELDLKKPFTCKSLPPIWWGGFFDGNRATGSNILIR